MLIIMVIYMYIASEPGTDSPPGFQMFIKTNLWSFDHIMYVFSFNEFRTTSISPI